MSHSTSTQRSVPLADWLDNVVLSIGKVLAWAYVILIAVIILQVVLRYGFSLGMVALEELQWHLYAVGVMFGVSYAQVTNSHIRVDLFHMRLHPRTQRLWEIFGILFLLFPFIAVVFFSSLEFVYDSWRIGETSDAPSGLSYRWLIKSAIPASFGLLFVAALSRLTRDLVLLVKER